MSAHNSMILLITLFVITTGGVLVLYEVTQGMEQVPQAMKSQREYTDELILVNVVGSNINDDSYKHINIQVRYEGDAQLNLNDTFIQLRTPSSTADLWYRNGTAERDNETGFYTE